MRKIIFCSITAFVTMASITDCVSSRPRIAAIDSFEQLEYRDPVRKTTLPVSGYTIAYTDQGIGDKTIILIHGLGSNLQAWNKNVEELSRNYRVIAIDLPGYGKSGKEPHSGLMSFYAAVVNEFARELNLGSVYLAGHSMGSQIAMTTALLYPDMVRGLILVSPAGFEYFDKGQRQWFRDVMTIDATKNTSVDGIESNLAVNFYRMPHDARFMITDRIAMRSAEKDFMAYSYAVSQSVKGMVDEPVLEFLGDIHVPTLIVYGQYDNLIPNRYLNPGTTEKIMQAGHRKIHDSKLVMLPKAGHFVMFEKSGEFNREVVTFLESLRDR